MDGVGAYDVDKDRVGQGENGIEGVGAPDVVKDREGVRVGATDAVNERDGEVGTEGRGDLRTD